MPQNERTDQIADLEAEFYSLSDHHRDLFANGRFDAAREISREIWQVEEEIRQARLGHGH
ncbi:hypothetical protein GT755_12530 [Herbidospora sp. NEAU-GS84]|uniref:Uncharacterized protein n=1 Tax=Herbidospora solisilvae TaxID=2696284 RepID=A0A7C9N0U3_9ACTN|nr:hypothetical protein [Herbidospora solisilvae]NAS22509.1 hypothetical protein [Herbidospora solisilvae]